MRTRAVRLEPPYLNRNSCSTGTTRSRSATMTHKRWRMARILVVEDERKVRRGVEQGLQSAGHEVATAATGNEGLRLATAESFDCLVLDWMLPGRDGVDVVRALRAD